MYWLICYSSVDMVVSAAVLTWGMDAYTASKSLLSSGYLRCHHRCSGHCATEANIYCYGHSHASPQVGIDSYSWEELAVG
ncbi:hypothetical protein Ccrd_003398 [Cynara cardunculus var. scolymus]|uniref:Uncharacterized protein n=1 Tax=Cynara cardunculus var. scolymus TaxID=59895 RepID=A0A103XPH2_CYNCS|nr:hypothetical protein Ccrd_003398 [Cynara cardunculus var. scolymus]